MTIRTNITKRKLPEPIEEFVANVCEQRKRNTNSFLPPCIIPVDAGNGRTTIMKEITNMLENAEVMEFSSHKNHCHEEQLKATIESINYVEKLLQYSSFATYTNEFQGIITLAINSLLPHLSDAVGDRFFRLAKRMQAGEAKGQRLLIIFVPSVTNQRQIELISNKLGIRTKVFDPVKYDDEYLARLFYDVSTANSKAIIKFEDCKKHILSYIQDGAYEKTLKNIVDSAEEVKDEDELFNSIYKAPKKSEKGKVI